MMRVPQESPTPQEGRKKSRADPRGIFLSYRRADSQAWVGRLADDLRRYYGRDRIYLDLDSNRPAQDYVVQVQEALKASRAVVAVVGPHWATQGRAGSDSRLNNPDDLLRRELETALADGIALLIVLVGGATVPSPDELPASLAPLARFQALRLADTDWSYDFGRVVEALERHGLYPARDPEGTPPDELQEALFRARRYERTYSASRRRALDAVISTVEALNYKDRRIDAEGANVTFRAAKREVVVKVIDAERGQSTAVVEFVSVRGVPLAVGSVAAAFATGGIALVAAWPALRAWERNFAKGFLDNVEGFLEGRGVGDDSVLPPGVSKWLNRTRQV